MLRAGISLPALMQLMGHAQIQTTHGLPSTHSTGRLGAIRSRRCPAHPARSADAVMKRKRIPLPTHPLTAVLPASGRICDDFAGGCIHHVLSRNSSPLSDLSRRLTIRRFTLSINCAAIPHILGWLALLRSHNPPLAAITRANYVIYLRRMLEELAWTQQLPALAHLLGRDDVPRKEHRLPRPLTPEQDQLIQQELLRRNDLR